MNALLMTLLLAAGLGAFAWTARNRLNLMRVARQPDDRSDQLGARVGNVLVYMFGQKRMFRYWGAGVAHALIFAGFVVLALRTLVLFARGFAGGPDSGFGFWIFNDSAPLGWLYLLLKDLIGIGVIAGVVYFLYLRLGPRPARMKHSVEGIFILCMILGIILSDAFYEGAGYVRHVQRIEQTRASAAAMAQAEGADPQQLDNAYRATTAIGQPAVYHAHTPLASTLALGLRGAPAGVVGGVHTAGFWLHSLIVLAFLNFLPYGKHFHVLTVLPNVLFGRAPNVSRGRATGIGALKPMQDIEGKLEREETLGARTVANYSWKDVLDFYTCTECGRCSDQCPATRTGKLLSPKQLTIDLRDHMYAHQGELVQQVAGENGAAAIKEEERYQLVPTVVNPEVIWACTTCGACEQECPVLITYVDKIVEMRRHQIMEQGAFPDQLQNAFRGLESVGNPYSFDNAQRAEWAEGLDVPLLSDKPDAEYLYWVGCAPSFDDRSRKIARALAELLIKAKVDFAILGPEETCNGDPARRAGNEYLFQMFATQNIETLNNYKVRKIITTCPHCFNILGNEYPAFGGNYEVIHHTELLSDLVRAGRLTPRHRVDGTIVFHDSCYLGRYNDVYEPPREILRSIPGLNVVEAVESRSRGMCCGAGGAQMWKEEEPTSREKVNHARSKQLLNVLPSEGERKVASACPFCKTMMSDALVDRGHEDVEQKDVAEYLLQSVRGPQDASTASTDASQTAS